MKQVVVLASLALIAGMGTARAQTTEEVAADLIMQAAEAFDRAREERQSRQAKQAQDEATRLENLVRERERRAKEDEQRRAREVAAIRRWPGLGAMTPPLQPGETYGESENGCGIVLQTDGATTVPMVKKDTDGKPMMEVAKPVLVQVSPQDFLRTMVWTGDCPNGLAHGLGALMPREYLPTTIDYKTEFFYGRELSRSLHPDVFTGSSNLNYRMPDKTMLTVPAWRDPFTPRFGKQDEGSVATELQFMLLSQDAEGAYRAKTTTVAAVIEPCTLLEKKPGGRSFPNMYDIHAVKVVRSGEGAVKVEHHACPEPGTARGCEVLWQQIAGPVIQEIQPRIAEAEALDKSRRERLTSLNSVFVLNARIHQMAQSAQAEQDVERRKAAALAAQQEIARKRDADLAKERAQAEQAARAFKAKLATLNAGQLYVLGDELKTAGKTADARDAFRALITRFPDHALASNAATALATL